MKGYTLKVSALAAALKCAGVKDVRYYLNGVYLDFQAGRIVGTDGHRLFCGEIPRADCPPVIVPRELVERVLKANRGLRKAQRQGAALFVSIGEPEAPTAATESKYSTSAQLRRVTFAHVLAGFNASELEIDGRFPEYMRVIPRKVDGTPAGFNADYIGDAGEALALYAEVESYKAPFFHWHLNGNGGAIFTRDGVPACVVIMPTRDTASEIGDALAWLDKPTLPRAELGVSDAEAAEAEGDVLRVETLGGVSLGTVPGPDTEAEGEHIVLETPAEDADPLS